MISHNRCVGWLSFATRCAVSIRQVWGANFRCSPVIFCLVELAHKQIGDSDIVDLGAAVVVNLVEGEVLQIKDVKGDKLSAFDGVPRGPAGSSMEGEKSRWDGWSKYLKKSYLKTASLIAGPR